MVKKKDRIISEWGPLLNELQYSSKAMALGVFNGAGKLVDANKAMCFFLNTSEEELSPQNSFVNPDLKKLIHPNTNDGVLFNGLATIGNYKDVSYTLDSKIIKKGDKYLVFCEADTPHLFEENKKMSRLNQEVNNLQRQLIKEKTKLQNTLTELKETQLMLIHSEKMNAMGKLVAGVAHEINNPISFVYSNMHSTENYVNELIQAFQKVELIAKQTKDVNLVSQIEEIHEKYDVDYLIEDLTDLTKESKKGVERVTKIIEDLRKFSRLDESEVKRIDLIDNLKSTLSIASTELKKREINYKTEFPDQLFIDCYPGQLNQAILNVLINAAQSIEKDGNIVISVKDRKDKVSITIEDNGCGIPSNILDRIFEPFFTTKEVGSGTGLGLSITYKIINDLHRGSIDIESKEKTGTKFIILIPKQIIIDGN